MHTLMEPVAIIKNSFISMQAGGKAATGIFLTFVILSIL